MTTAIAERACEQCRGPVTGRADKRFCSDSCRLASRSAERRSRANEQPSSRARDTASRAAVVSVSRAEPVLTWDPSSASRRAYEVAEPCPLCGGMLLASPGGTLRVCGACRRRVVPTAVVAPYRRDGGAPQRRVLSQRERDLEDLNLAGWKDELLGRVAASRVLSDGSVVAEQLTGKIRAASSARRLGELEELLDVVLGAGGAARPGVVEVDVLDDEIAEAEIVEEPAELAASPRLAIAAAPVSPLSTWAAALAAIGGRIIPGSGGCEIAIGARPPCGTVATRQVSSASACEQHYYQLVSLITGRSG